VVNVTCKKREDSEDREEVVEVVANKMEVNKMEGL